MEKDYNLMYYDTHHISDFIDNIYNENGTNIMLIDVQDAMFHEFAEYGFIKTDCYKLWDYITSYTKKQNRGAHFIFGYMETESAKFIRLHVYNTGHINTVSPWQNKYTDFYEHLTYDTDDAWVRELIVDERDLSSIPSNTWIRQMPKCEGPVLYIFCIDLFKYDYADVILLLKIVRDIIKFVNCRIILIGNYSMIFNKLYNKLYKYYYDEKIYEHDKTEYVYVNHGRYNKYPYEQIYDLLDKIIGHENIISTTTDMINDVIKTE